MKRSLSVFVTLCGFYGLNAIGETYSLINGKEIENPIILSYSNNLVRILHDGGDNTYQFNYFTKPTQKKILNTPVNVAKLKELEAIKAAEEQKRKERLEIKNDPNREPPFPVTLSDIEYLGGDVASMTVTSVSKTNVQVNIISGRIVQASLILKPDQVKKRVMFRHNKRHELLVKSGSKQKTIVVD